jgi:hypothetical protein
MLMKHCTVHEGGPTVMSVLIRRGTPRAAIAARVLSVLLLMALSFIAQLSNATRPFVAQSLVLVLTGVVVVTSDRQAVARMIRLAARVGIVLAVTLAPAVVGTQPSQAAPRSTSDYLAPYDSASAPLDRQCTTGATCTTFATVEPGTGKHTATVDYRRDTATTGQERVEGDGLFRQAVQLPKGSTAATVTATWHINSATATANSRRGFLHAGSVLLAKALCDGGCVAEFAVAQVTLACSQEGVVACSSAPGSDDSRASDVDVVVTATVRNLAKPSFTFWTQALSYVDARPMCGASISATDPVPVTDECSTTIDPVHSGTGHSDLDATFIGFHIDASGSST